MNYTIQKAELASLLDLYFNHGYHSITVFNLPDNLSFVAIFLSERQLKSDKVYFSDLR